MPRSKKDKKESPQFDPYRALIENAHEGVVIYSETGTIKYASDSVRRICGYKKEEVLEQGGALFIHPDDVEQARLIFYDLVKKPGHRATIFQRLIHKKGHYIWVESLLTNFLHIPEIKGVVSNFRDITEKKMAEEKAREAQYFMETISANLTEGIFMGVLGKRFLYVNDAFVKITGYKSREEFLRLKPQVLYLTKDDRQRIISILMMQRTIRQQVMRFRRKDRTTFLGLVNISMLDNPNEPGTFVGTVRDITREKDAEDQLRDTSNFLNNIVDTVAAPIFVKDQKYRWVMFNEAFCKLLRLPRHKILHQTDTDFFPEEEVKVFRKADNRVLRTGATLLQEETITPKRGAMRNLLTVKSRYVNEKGEKFIIGFITDITEVKRSAQRISQLHSNLVGVMESSSESIFAVDQNLCYTAFNQQHQRIMKQIYGADIRIGGRKQDYVRRSKDARWIREELARALKGEHFIAEHEQNTARFKGSIQAMYNPIRDEEGQIKGVAVFIQDITARKKFERMIRSANANLSAVMESTVDGILAIDRQFRYIFFNKAHAKSMKKIFGVEVQAGANMLELIPEPISSFTRKQIMKVFRGKQLSEEVKVSDDYVAETSYNPIVDESGQIMGAALFVKDITERKKMEEQLYALNRELQDQNNQLAAQEEELKATLEELSQRNFELDQLMYKTSHDLRSPLSSIMGLINLSQLDPDPANLREYLNKIEGRVKKLDEFISSMLNYARVNRVDAAYEPIDLEQAVQECVKELMYLESFNTVKLITDIRQPMKFCGDPLRVKIILSNIISNAYKYYNPEAKSFLKIVIRTSPKEADIRIEDNGIGIRQQYLDKIFNMFFRATERAQGSGLGMYIVKQAVDKLQGKISIRSEYGAGTTISIQLPNQHV